MGPLILWAPYGWFGISYANGPNLSVLLMNLYTLFSFAEMNSHGLGLLLCKPRSAGEITFGLHAPRLMFLCVFSLIQQTWFLYLLVKSYLGWWCEMCYITERIAIFTIYYQILQESDRHRHKPNMYTAIKWKDNPQFLKLGMRASHMEYFQGNCVHTGINSA